MLSYRHAFHAGNHADVLKHLCLQQGLKYLTQKEKPLCYVDSHAGGGAYSLKSIYANKTLEYVDGIGRLWAATDLPAPLAEYRDMVKAFNATDNKTGELLAYPGSPWVAQHCLRSHDRLFLHDLHTSEVPELQENFGSDARIQIEAADGFQRTVALMPPREKRGLVLMDPSYEMKSDFKEVVNTLDRALKRFSSGVYMIWYPVVERSRIDQLEKNIAAVLAKHGIDKVGLYEFSPKEDSRAIGMTGSGMIVINPPWKLKETMKLCLPYMTRKLADHGHGHYRINDKLDMKSEAKANAKAEADKRGNKRDTKRGDVPSYAKKDDRPRTDNKRPERTRPDNNGGARSHDKARPSPKRPSVKGKFQRKGR